LISFTLPRRHSGLKRAAPGITVAGEQRWFFSAQAILIMTIPILLASIQLSSVVPAQHIIVFGKHDSLTFATPASAPAPTDPAKAAFLAKFKSDLEQPAGFEAPIPLTEFPQWGRLVPGAAGALQYHRSFAGGFVVKVAVEGLLPKHRYILTLNGNPERAGNDNLVDPVPGNKREKFFDFQTVTTDSKGSYLATFAVALPKGPYDTRFYVKDTSDFKIILFHEFFRFDVE
jgi:hypothetical protein